MRVRGSLFSKLFFCLAVFATSPSLYAEPENLDPFNWEQQIQGLMTPINGDEQALLGFLDEKLTLAFPDWLQLQNGRTRILWHHEVLSETRRRSFHPTDILKKASDVWDYVIMDLQCDPVRLAAHLRNAETNYVKLRLDTLKALVTALRRHPRAAKPGLALNSRRICELLYANFFPFTISETRYERMIQWHLSYLSAKDSRTKFQRHPLLFLGLDRFVGDSIFQALKSAYGAPFDRADRVLRNQLLQWGDQQIPYLFERTSEKSVRDLIRRLKERRLVLDEKALQFRLSKNLFGFLLERPEKYRGGILKLAPSLRRFARLFHPESVGREAEVIRALKDRGWDLEALNTIVISNLEMNMDALGLSRDTWLDLMVTSPRERRIQGAYQGEFLVHRLADLPPKIFAPMAKVMRERMTPEELVRFFSPPGAAKEGVENTQGLFELTRRSTENEAKDPRTIWMKLRNRFIQARHCQSELFRILEEGLKKRTVTPDMEEAVRLLSANPPTTEDALLLLDRVRIQFWDQSRRLQSTRLMQQLRQLRELTRQPNRFTFSGRQGGLCLAELIKELEQQ